MIKPLCIVPFYDATEFEFHWYNSSLLVPWSHGGRQSPAMEIPLSSSLISSLFPVFITHGFVYVLVSGWEWKCRGTKRAEQQRSGAEDGGDQGEHQESRGTWDPGEIHTELWTICIGHVYMPSGHRSGSLFVFTFHLLDVAMYHSSLSASGFERALQSLRQLVPSAGSERKQPVDSRCTSSSMVILTLYDQVSHWT